MGNTQKVITTPDTNTFAKTVATRRYTVPDEKLMRIYAILQTKQQPFVKLKSEVHKLETKKQK